MWIFEKKKRYSPMKVCVRIVFPLVSLLYGCVNVITNYSNQMFCLEDFQSTSLHLHQSFLPWEHYISWYMCGIGTVQVCLTWKIPTRGNILHIMIYESMNTWDTHFVQCKSKCTWFWETIKILIEEGERKKVRDLMNFFLQEVNNIKEKGFVEGWH